VKLDTTTLPKPELLLEIRPEDFPKIIPGWIITLESVLPKGSGRLHHSYLLHRMSSPFLSWVGGSLFHEYPQHGLLWEMVEWFPTKKDAEAHIRTHVGRRSGACYAERFSTAVLRCVQRELAFRAAVSNDMTETALTQAWMPEERS